MAKQDLHSLPKLSSPTSALSVPFSHDKLFLTFVSGYRGEAAAGEDDDFEPATQEATQSTQQPKTGGARGQKLFEGIPVAARTAAVCGAEE